MKADKDHFELELSVYLDKEVVEKEGRSSDLAIA